MKRVDAVVIGSGFGGSVAALRLAEKGYSVAVLEQGRRITPEDMEAAATSPRKLLWAPHLGMRGYFARNVYHHITILGGVGVGGGSLVYAAVLLRPRTKFAESPLWGRMGIDWEKDLEPHYATAERMLGVKPNPWFGEQDEYLKAAAEAMNAGETFGPVPQGIYFGEPDVRRDDPYFGGKGPARTGCRFCGECMTGCRFDSKNTLDKNYLYLAEKLGAEILPEHRATAIRPDAEGGYVVDTANGVSLSAKKVFLSAGVLGTLELLFRCRDELKTLPGISRQLGKVVRTNSEAIPGILSNDPETDLTEGTGISTHFYANADTHITQNRFARGWEFMKWYMGPLVDDPVPWRRSLRTLGQMMLHPVESTRPLRAKNFHKRFTGLTVMQDLDNEIAFRYGRSPFSLGIKRLQSVPVAGREAPSYIPEANAATRAFAEAAGGQPVDNLMTSLLNTSITAHILGGACMGDSPENGVVNSEGELFGYPGIHVTDASIIPANVGVNPSLTITALAEYCMSRVEPVESGR